MSGRSLPVGCSCPIKNSGVSKELHSMARRQMHGGINPSPLYADFGRRDHLAFPNRLKMQFGFGPNRKVVFL